jgi:hypothetical protein
MSNERKEKKFLGDTKKQDLDTTTSPHKESVAHKECDAKASDTKALQCESYAIHKCYKEKAIRFESSTMRKAKQSDTTSARVLGSFEGCVTTFWSCRVNLYA